MLNIEIFNAVKNLADLFAAIPDDQLNHPWHWKGHDEGVRFAAFLTLLELQTLAVKLAENRPAPQPGHRILGQYHAAYLDLQAALSGISPEDANRAHQKRIGRFEEYTPTSLARRLVSVWSLSMLSKVTAQANGLRSQCRIKTKNG